MIITQNRLLRLNDQNFSNKKYRFSKSIHNSYNEATEHSFSKQNIFDIKIVGYQDSYLENKI